LVIFHDCLFPGRAPARRAWGCGPIADRTTIPVAARNDGAAKEAQPGVIEVVRIEVIDHHLRARSTHERVEVLVLEEHVHAHPRELVAVVLADRTPLSHRIVLLADS